MDCLKPTDALVFLKIGESANLLFFSPVTSLHRGGRMAKVLADEYRRKSEDCRVQAERDSGDRKGRWLDLAHRWDAAADQIEISLAAVDAERDLCAGGVDRRQEPPMQDIAHPDLNASSPPDTAPPIRKRRFGLIACGVSALAVGLAGGFSLQRAVDRDQSAAALPSFAGAQKQVGIEGRLERIERQSDVGVASQTAKPVVQDALGISQPAAELATPAPSAKNKASVKPTWKDWPPSTDTKAIADWSASGRI